MPVQIDRFVPNPNPQSSVLLTLGNLEDIAEGSHNPNTFVSDDILHYDIVGYASFTAAPGDRLTVYEHDDGTWTLFLPTAVEFPPVGSQAVNTRHPAYVLDES